MNAGVPTGEAMENLLFYLLVILLTLIVPPAALLNVMGILPNVTTLVVGSHKYLKSISPTGPYLQNVIRKVYKVSITKFVEEGRYIHISFVGY
jgi:hypothetical protein